MRFAKGVEKMETTFWGMAFNVKNFLGVEKCAKEVCQLISSTHLETSWGGIGSEDEFVCELAQVLGQNMEQSGVDSRRERKMRHFDGTRFCIGHCGPAFVTVWLEMGLNVFFSLCQAKGASGLSRQHAQTLKHTSYDWRCAVGKCDKAMGESNEGC
jgi:hypothetical protein